jgi:hypothetical protein
MDWTRVASTHIAQVAYEEGTQRLGVRFADGSEYEYHNVPVEVVEAFMSSPSKGHFFKDRIKGGFEFERMT